MVNIESERCVYRYFSMDDVEELYNSWCRDESAAKYCTWNTHNSIEDTKEFVHGQVNEDRSKENSYLMVSKETGELVGTVVLHFIEEGRAECGYIMRKEYRGQGYATEGLQTLIEIGKKLGYSIFEAEHHVENLASGNVMKKCGFKFVGSHFREFKKGSGIECETMCYELLP